MSAAMTSEDDDARLNERMSKARSELSELQKIMTKDNSDLSLHEGNGPASRTRSRSSNAQYDSKRPPSMDIDYHLSPSLVPGETMMWQKEIVEGGRLDRMRIAELSNEQLRPATEKEAAASSFARRHKILMKQDKASMNSRRTTPKDLRDCSTDYVQQALNFDNGTADDEDEAASLTSQKSIIMPRMSGKVNREIGKINAEKNCGLRTHQNLRTYVQQMEETIVQLVQQKDDLLRNQAEFDKQASGIFPSLENLNHQLSQIVQGKLLQSGHSPHTEDVANLHEDMLDELRVQREQLSELEADTKRRKYDAELQEQDRAIEISQIKADIINVVASEKMRDKRAELMLDSMKKGQQELQEAVANLVQRFHILDKRMNQLHTHMTQPSLVGNKSRKKSNGDCNAIERCHPLI
ncbi:hypothetical protein CCR75_002031 [Bremia lactucae]|uniref:Uncharacterized protein n=1 Tax=Bremia lactucae TaxID=4779 RepID=A0A976IBC4_BRELC|nr:hypothetical protein CCR75_002031 [Bremia lactucae]